MARPGNVSIALLFALVLVLVGAPVLAFVAQAPADEERAFLAMRRTAELAFLVYVVIFVARPARDLVPNRLTQALNRVRPQLGVSFAATMSVHLSVVGWWYLFVSKITPSAIVLIAGGLAYVLMFLMLMTTFTRPADAIGPRNWRRLHKFGLYWIGIIFANTLLPRAINNLSDPLYLTLGALILLALSVRISAWVKKRNQRTAATDSAR